MKEYKYEGETFFLDDSKGCYVEVKYEGETAYFGVNLHSGSDERPYLVAGAWESSGVQPDGLNWGYNARTFEAALNSACSRLLARQKQLSFDREEACKALHDQFESL